MTNDNSYSEDLIKCVRHEGKAVVLELVGEIDMESSAELKSKLKELYKEKPPVLIVNMTHVPFMDSSGLATLVGALKWCRENSCELKLVGLIRRVRSIFEICRLESVFQFYDSEAEALS
jgi:anti-sigma B factor antagonist